MINGTNNAHAPFKHYYAQALAYCPDFVFIQIFDSADKKPQLHLRQLQHFNIIGGNSFVKKATFFLGSTSI